MLRPVLFWRAGGLALLAVSTLVLLSAVVSASQSHWSDGTGGSHSTGCTPTGSHCSNPGHLQISLGAPLGHTTTSGGRFHDHCTSTACFQAFTGDYALDFDANDGEAVKLYLDFNAVGLNPDPNIDLNKDIRIEAKVKEEVGTAECQYQKYNIYATYWGVDGNQYVDKFVPYFWFMHLTNWAYDDEDPINPNASYTIPEKSGKVYWINGITLGYAATDGGGPCAFSGSHAHVEVFNKHAWGGQEEWHSCSTDPEWADGYSGSAYSYAEVHACDYPLSNGNDPVTQGEDAAYIGGGRTQFRMMNNDHTGISDH